jgi:hypothetical protein
MSYKPNKLLTLTAEYAEFAESSLTKLAKEVLDPKAKVRNRGTVCVPAESAKDKKDHFPINDEAQARNALAQVAKFNAVPAWYSGTLEGLKKAVRSKVHAKYPSIKEAPVKKSSLMTDFLISKYGQVPATNPPKTNPAAQPGYNPTEQTDADAEAFMKNPTPPSQGDAFFGKGTPAKLDTSAIMKVQQFLKSKGYDLGTFGPNKDGVDGKLGGKTKTALKGYQRSKGLPETGIDDVATWKALQQDMGGFFNDNKTVKAPIDLSAARALIEQAHETMKDALVAYQSGDMMKNPQGWLASFAPFYHPQRGIPAIYQQLNALYASPQTDPEQKKQIGELLPKLNETAIALGQYYAMLNKAQPQAHPIDRNNPY